MRLKKIRCTMLIMTIAISITLVGCGNDSSNITPTTEDFNQISIQSETLVDDSKTLDEAETLFENEQEIGSVTQDSEEIEVEVAKQTEEETGLEELSKEEQEEIAAKEEERRKEQESQAAEEEARKKQEEKERNSFSMMYYLAITAEDIRTSKDNRLILDDIYTSLLNDINPGAIDELTQDHLNNLRDIIKAYISISTKRERLQYIYNQNKAAAMRSAVPNPLAVLSMSNSLDWRKLAMSAVYTVADSYRSYKNANDAADKEYLMSGWDLDDEELATVQKNRERAFNYMVDMVQEYDLDGLKTLSEKDIQNFTEICDIEYPTEKIKRLKAEEKKYELLGNYWYELANCYFENSQYSLCLECVEKYNELSSGIYKQDSNKVKVLPKAIVAAQNTYFGEKYVSVIDDYANQILENTTTEDWSTRYFVAQTYIDLYSKTNRQQYLEDAFKIVSENVTVLLKGQREINDIYLNDVVEEVAIDPKTTIEYQYLTKDQQKQKDSEYSAEKDRVKEFNKGLKEARKKELISVYEPLVLNCELLFALSEKTSVSRVEKKEIDDILQNNVFLVEPIKAAYSFSSISTVYDAKLSKDEIIIPASLLTSGSVIEVKATDNGVATTFNDCAVTSVNREGDTIDTFKAHISGKQWKQYPWTADSRISIKIIYGDVYDKEITLNYKVGVFEDHWYGDKVEFVKE